MEAIKDITVDQTAVARVKALRESGKNADFGPQSLLRITVTSGGCSGFQYIMEPSAEIGEDDVVFADAVVIDNASIDIMKGSVIRFADDMTGAQFVVDNPNASSGCGCGASFSVNVG